MSVPRCQHMNFVAEVDVHRLTESEEPDARVKGYLADVRIKCSECGKRFQFLGLPAGIDTQGIGMSVDGLEARLALCPQGEHPSPLDRIAVNFPTKRRH